MAERYDFYVHDNRKITFNLTEPIMREDSGVTDFVFHIPKILNELEVSDWQWWLVFVNAKKEKYSIALTLSDDPERPLEFNTATYTVGYAMSIKAGSVQFALEAINTGTGGAIDNEWHTLTYETKVKETLQGNQAEYAETESDVISALLIEVRNKVNQLVGGATPTPVASVSAMTDTSKLYLLTTDGEWYYHNGTQFVSGGVYGAGIVDSVPTQGSTNAVSSGGVYDAVAGVADDVTGLKADISTLTVYRYAGEIAQTGNGFVSNAGVVTANNNYKYVKYSLHAGTQKITVDSMYVTGTASNYAAFAFFDSADAMISAVNNQTINSTSIGNTFTNVEADVPLNADYVLITFGNMASSTTFSTITEIGLYKPATNKRVFNNGLNSSNKQFFYFHTTASELDDYTSLAFNAKFKTESPVLSYEVYFTGYDADYTNRVFAIYKTGLTKGINGNTVTIAENFQNTANSLSAKTYIGVVVNFLYAYSSETGARTGISNANLYAVTSEYCMLNDTELELAYYPASGFTTLSTEYSEHYNPLYGGFLCAIGDSLTGVYYKAEEETWVSLIAKWNNMQYENLGVSGNPIAKPDGYASKCMAERVDDLSATKFYSHIFVMGGANDYNESVPIGSNSDTTITTFKGAINHIIATLTQKFPNAHIVFATTYRRNQAYADKPYADAMMEVCKLHSIPCLNNYENSGVQFFDSNWMAVYGATNALGNNHLNAAGDLFVAPRFEHALKYGVPTYGSTNTISSGGDSTNLINGYFTPAVEGTGNISRDDGSVVANASYYHSDYIDISGYDKLTTRSVQGSAFNAFYDANKTFISAFVVASGTDKTIIIPDNAVYMRVSDSTARYNDTFVFKHLSRDNTDKIDGLRDSLAVLADQTIYIPTIAGTGYIAVNDATVPDGDIVANASYSHSDYIDISDYDKLYIDGAVYGSSFNAFYNTSKQFISAFSVPTGNSTINIPDNAVYMRVSNPTAKYDTTFRFKPISHANAVRIAALESGGGGSTEEADYFTPEIISTGYISNNDGTEQSNGNYSRSDYVDISRFGKLITTASYDSAFNAFYTANKTFIQAFTIRTGTDKVVEVPDNAVYMRVSTKTTQYEDSFQFRVLDYVNSVRIDDLEDAVDTLADSIAHSGDTFAPPSVGTGNVSREDGSIVSGSYLHSDYIDISQFPKLLTVAGDGSAFNAFYKADKTFISSFSIVAGTDKIIEIPDGAMYMRVSGSSSKYANTMKFRTLEYVTSDALPEYWFGHVADRCESIKGHMNTIGRNGDTFAFVTDIHWYSNQQMSPKLIRYLLNHLNINMVALGGDLIRQGTKAEEITESMKCVKAFRFTDTFVPIAFGNHDNNSNQSDATQRFDASTIYSLFMKGFEDSVTWITDTEFSFYFDKPANKTRYIFLDMGDDGVSKAFTAFAEFRDALNSTPNGYKVVIVAHIIDYGTFTTSLTQMIDAYNARTSVTVNSVVCDFTSASGSVVICLGGHRHYDDETATAGGVPITVTDCDAMLSVSDITETAGTITEQAFDVVSLDYTNMIAYYERIGRNKSRIIHLTPVSASTTLTASLSGTITWSSGDDSIATVSSGTITRVAAGTVIIRADNGTETEIWVCNS